MIKIFGNPIGWDSKLQSNPAKSTTEAEWYAVDLGLRECLWVKGAVVHLTQIE